MRSRFAEILIFRTSQKLKLGHKSSKTTEIYTHVSNKEIGEIKSPLDLIIKNSYIENEVEGDEC
ncbi:MAG TPA: hypothetical protein C5S37_05205 [Methanophagales archaeon]|nr:hypothetical protein [Methanophagales archaeon]